MKTISSRFLKAGISVLLVVMLLLSTTATGLAAVVENAQTSANVDLADTGADSYYVCGNMSASNWSTHLPMTKGTDTSDREIWYIGPYSSQYQFKITKGDWNWSIGSSNNTSSLYSNSLSMYQYGNTGNCWPASSSSYYIVYTVTEDKISCVTTLPLKTVTNYTVTYNGNGGTPASTERSTVDGKYSFPEDPTRSGYFFKGWYTAASGGTKKTESDTCTSDTTLYAQWETGKTVYVGLHNSKNINDTSNPIELHCWGGGYDLYLTNFTDLSLTKSYAVGSSYWSNNNQTWNMYSILIPSTCTGYQFHRGNWNDNAYGESKEIDENKFLLMWEYSNAHHDTLVTPYADVTWELDNGSSDDTSTVNVGTVPTHTDPTKSGYTFSSWSPTPAAITVADALNSSGVTYTAQYTQNNVTVTFDANGHGTAPTAQTFTPGSTATNPGTLTATGYTHDGKWYTDSACTTQFDFSTAVNSNITLYAKWTINSYIVTFNANGHGSAPSAQNVNYNAKATNPGTLTATGYTHDGNWYTNSGCTTQFNFNTAITGNITLYAKWTAKTWSVTLDRQSGTGGSSSVTVTYNQAVPAVTAPTRTNYNFMGYYSGTNGTGTKYIDADGSSVSGNKVTSESLTTLYAYWQLAGVCSPTFATSTKTLAFGEQYTQTASKNAYCQGSSFTYSSSDTTVATVNATTGQVTALKKAGTATITATCATDGTTGNYTVNVVAPSVSFTNSSAITLNIGAQSTRTVEVENIPQTGTGTYSYTSSSTNVTVSGSGTTATITAVGPVTNAQITAIYTYNGTQYTSSPIIVNVNTPTVSVSPTSVTLKIGDTSILTATTTNPTNNSAVTYSSSKTSVATVDSSGKITAISNGTAIITATYTVGSTTKTATCAVTVSEPTVSIDDVTVKEDGTATLTSTPTNAPTSGVTYVYSITEGASFASVSGTTLTGLKAGQATVQVDMMYNGSSIAYGTATVTVQQRYITIYLTDNPNWGDIALYYYGNDVTAAQIRMVNIGTNEFNQNIYACKYDTNIGAAKFIFHMTTSATDTGWTGGNPGQTAGFDAATTDQGYYLTSGGDNANWEQHTYTFKITLPTVTPLADKSVSVGTTTETIGTTITNYGSLAWSSANTDAVELSGTTSVATINAKAVGSSVVTVKAYSRTQNDGEATTSASLKTLNTSDDAAFEFIGASSSATVTVTNVERTVTAAAMYSSDGTNFTTGTTGGTAYVGSTTSPTTTTATISYGGNVYLNATATSPYVFAGWYANGTLLSGVNANATINNVTANTDYVAKFVKTYTVTLNAPSGITITTDYTGGSLASVPAGTVIKATATGSSTARVNTFTVNGTTYTSGTAYTVTGDTTFAATATPLYAANSTVYTNGASSSAGGSVTTDHASCAVGETVTYTAERNSTYTFDGWYPAGTTVFSDTNRLASTTTYTATMTASGTNVIAHFHKNLYYWYKNSGGSTLVSYNPETNVYTQSLANVTPGGGENGDFWIATESGNSTAITTTSVTGEGVNLTQSTGTKFYLGDVNSTTHTTPVSLTITPTATGNPTSYNVVATATAKAPLNVSVNANDAAAYTSTSGTGTHYSGNSVTVSFNMVEGYFLENATATGNPTGLSFDKSAGTVTFTMGSNDVVVNATFSRYYTATATAYTNKVESTTGGTVAISGADVGDNGFKSGSTITYTASAKTGYDFIGWFTDNTYNTQISTNLSNNGLTYSPTQTTSGTSVVALFAKTYYITGAAVGGWGTANETANWNKMTYDIAHDQYTYSSSDFTNTNNKFLITKSNNFTNKVTATATTCEGFESFSQVSSDNSNYVLGNIDDSMYTTPVTYYLAKSGSDYTVVNVVATMADAYDFTVTGANTVETLHTKYPANNEVIFNIDIDSNSQYVYSVTPTGNPTNLTFTEQGAVSLTMPANAVTLDVVVKDKNQVTFTNTSGLDIVYDSGSAYYKPGDTVSVKVKAKSASYALSDQFSVVARSASPKSRTVDGDAIDHTVTTEGDYYVITFTAPEEGFNVEITPQVSANFKVECDSTTGGTVTMTANGSALAQGGYVEAGTAVTMTATADSGYTFLGYYSSSEYDYRITKAAIYNFTPNANTKYYAVFAKDYYIVGDPSGSWSKFVKMNYDPKNGYYYYDSDLIETGGEFKIYPQAAFEGYMFDSYASVDTAIHTGTAGLSITKNGGTGTGANNGKIYDVQEGYGSPIRIYFKQIGTNEYKFDAKATEIQCKVYLSGGVDDMYGTSEHDLAISTFVKNAGDTYNVSDRQMIRMTDAGKQLSEVVPYSDSNASVESWVVATLPEAQSITVQTQIYNYVEDGWNYRDMYRVAAYVIYYSDGTTDSVTGDGINYMGNGTYSATIDVEGTCYIIPVYYNTDAYNEAKGQVSVYFYVDADTIRNEVWGPFYACYVYGTHEYNGSWPGQVMIPTKDGKTYFQRLDIEPGTINGVVINNFVKNTVPAKSDEFRDDFGITTLGQVQTYDYKEPIYLYRAGYNTFTFECKLNEDGYHGQYAGSDGMGGTNTTDNWEKISGGKNIDLTEFTFQPLVDRNGRYLDLSGNIINNPDEDADFYIVAAGDVDYSSGDYEYDEDYSGSWSVDWYVYDKNGNYITNILSGAIFDRDDSPSNPSGLERALAATNSRYTAAYLAGKTVAISYENNNVCNGGASTTAPRTDGQWSGNRSDDNMTVNVKVGLYENDDFTVNETDPVNVASYGEAYVSADQQTANVTYASPLANLTASAESGYVFIGWYTMKGGTYVKSDEAPSYQATITGDITYYAMFQQVNADDLVINHIKYFNDTDSEIMSHNGTASMEVEIYELADGQSTGGTLVAKADPSKSQATAIANVKDGTNYRIVIKTTPLNQGAFYAWYTDTDEGYEEILTLGDDVDKTSTVTTEFIYEVSNSNTQRIVNIYSDVTRVTNEATLVYKYLNRFGQWRTYTVSGIKLSDDECGGFAGNENNPYVPAYLDKHTLVKDGADDVVVWGGTADAAVAKYPGYSWKSTDNKIQNHAPSNYVTEAFNQDITWKVVSTKYDLDKSIVTLLATQKDTKYTFTANNYNGDGESKVSEGEYNTLMEVTAAAEDSNGKPFLYWYDETDPTNPFIVTYSRFLNYRITEDRTVTAVYDDNSGEGWSAAIEKVTQTREFQNSGSSNTDYVYVDYLISFAHPKKIIAQDVKDEMGYKYGIILVSDSSYRYSGNGEFTYPTANQATLEYCALNSKSGKKGDVRYYCYDLSSNVLTNKNRMNYYIQYDNNSANEYKNWTFTAYAYFVDENGNVSLSIPQNVNIYDAATRDPLQ